MDQHVLTLFWTLAEGCTKHLPYRGKKAPSTECPGCQAVWNARLYLLANHPQVEDNGLYRGSFDPRCFFCGMQENHSPEQHYRSIGVERQRR